jgi:porin
MIPGSMVSAITAAVFVGMLTPVALSVPSAAQGWSPVEGMTLELAGTVDALAHVHGGRDRGTTGLYSADAMVSLDGKALGAWRGLGAFFHGIRLGGDAPTERVGDIQGVSNIEGPEGWVLYEAWVEQMALDGRLSVLAGLYGVDSEFDVIQSASLFMHSSHGTGPDFSQIGRNGPSIFPDTRLGIRVRALTSSATSMQMAVLHEDPGSIVVVEGSWFKVDRRQRVEPDAEIGGQSVRRRLASRMGTVPLAARIAVGAWTATDGAPGNRGAWVLAERRIPTRQTGAVFVRMGVAERSSDARSNRVQAYTGAGIVHPAPIPGRNMDTIGLGLAIAHENSRQRETAIEAAYRVFVSPRLSVQADIQWVKNPLDADAVSAALLLGLRFLASW